MRQARPRRTNWASVPVAKDCPFAGPNLHTIQPSSLALSLASFQALTRNSDTVIPLCEMRKGV